MYKQDGKSVGSKGFGTYQTTIIGKYLPKNMGIYVQRITSAYTIFINSKEVGKNGIISSKSSNYKPNALIRYFPFSPQSDTLNVVVHVANFDLRNGGLERPFRIGEQADIRRFYEHKIAWDVFLVGAFLMISFYHIFLIVIVRRDIANLWFACATLLIAVRTLAVQNYYLVGIFPSVSIQTVITLSHMTISLPLVFFSLYFLCIFEQSVSKLIIQIIILVSLIHTIFVLVMPALIFEQYLGYVQLFIVISMSYFGYVLLVSRRKYHREFYIFIISFLILFVIIVNDILHAHRVIQTANLISFGTLIFIFSQSAILSLRFSDAFFRIKKLSHELSMSNKKLENKVLERTKKLSESHEELNRMLETSQAQKHEIELKNSDITASITYANRIQQAMLPSDNDFDNYFAAHFILYLPRDIVSGDFYRIYEKNNKVVLICADCTGHGIPGAFMSLIGSSLLDKIIIDWHSFEPHIILNQLHTNIRSVLKQKEKQNTDGMDIAICMMDKSEQKLLFSGAKSPLLLIQDDQLHLIKGTRHSIGGNQMGMKRTYASHSFELNSTTQFYLFSDGFQDQFGGESGRKFMSKRFRNLIYEHSHLTMAEQKSNLEQTLKNWMIQGNEKQNDDILVIGIRPFSD